METLENNESKLSISITSDDAISIASLLSNIDFFKSGFEPDTFEKIIAEAKEQHYTINETVFYVYINKVFPGFKYFTS